MALDKGTDMNKTQANNFLAKAGYAGLIVDKAEGVYYLIGEEAGIDWSVDRCLHVVRLSDLTEDQLTYKLSELFKESN